VSGVDGVSVPPSPLASVLVLVPASADAADVDAVVGAPASVPVMPFAAGLAGAGFAGAGFAGAGFAGAGFAVCAETVEAAPGSMTAEAIRAAKKAFFMVVVIRVLSLLAGGLRGLSGIVENLSQLLVE
jgi:hypothetical protein